MTTMLLFAYSKVCRRYAFMLFLVILPSNKAFPQFDPDSVRSGLVYITVTAETSTGVPKKTHSTGFFIDRFGRILTVYHAISDLGEHLPDTMKIYVSKERKDGDSIRAEIIDFKENRDVLLLKVVNFEAGEPLCVDIAHQDESLIAMEVFTAGFPQNLQFVTGAGHVIAEGPGGSLVTSLVLNPGQSGSPILDSENRVVGIAKGQMEDDDRNPVEGQYVFLPISDAVTIVWPYLVGNPGCPGRGVGAQKFVTGGPTIKFGPAHWASKCPENTEAISGTCCVNAQCDEDNNNILLHAIGPVHLVKDSATIFQRPLDHFMCVWATSVPEKPIVRAVCGQIAPRQ